MTRETAPSDRTAIIVGAGIAGLATALSLARAKWSVIVLERAARLRGGAFVVGFSGMGYEAATRLGLVEELRARASPWRPMQQVDGDGRGLARMSEASQRALTGHRTVSILRGDLEGALYGAAQHVADIRFGQTVTDVTDGADGAVVTLRDGSRVAADLVIGADGAHSTVRRLVFDPEDRWRYDFGAKVASFEVIDPPTSVREKTTLLTAVGRSAGLYPQRDGRLSAFFTFVRDDAGTADAAASLGRAYGDLGWVWPDLIQRAVSAESIFAAPSDRRRADADSRDDHPGRSRRLPPAESRAPHRVDGRRSPRRPRQARRAPSDRVGGCRSAALRRARRCVGH